MELNSENLYRYQNGFMTIQETLDFEELLENNPDFQARIEQVEDPVFKHLADNRAFIDELLEAKAKPIPFYLKIYRKKVFALAASVIVLVGLGWFVRDVITSRSESVSVKTPDIETWEKLNQLAGDNNETKGFAGPSTEEKIDTLCDCANGLRLKFAKDKQAFLHYLNEWKPVRLYQKQCKTYWLGWIYLYDNQYSEAQGYFEEIYNDKNLSGLIRQRATIGYMKTLIYQKKTATLAQVAAAVINEPIYWKDTHDFAAKVMETMR